MIRQTNYGAKPKPTTRENIAAAVAALPAKATRGDMAAAGAEYGAVYALRADPYRGDVGFWRGNSLGGDDWGVTAISRGDREGARRLIESAPDCLIGVRDGSGARVVIDPESRVVRGWKTIQKF